MWEPHFLQIAYTQNQDESKILRLLLPFDIFSFTETSPTLFLIISSRREYYLIIIEGILSEFWCSM